MTDFERESIANDEQGWELEVVCVGLNPDDLDSGYQRIDCAESAKNATSVVWGVYFRDTPFGCFDHVIDHQTKEAALAHMRKMAAKVELILRDIKPKA